MAKNNVKNFTKLTRNCGRVALGTIKKKLAVASSFFSGGADGAIYSFKANWIIW